MSAATNGRFVWFDLLTPDIPAAKSFYAELVGWKPTLWSGGNYEIWNAGEQMVGGVMSLMPGGTPHWLGYVATEDVDGACERTQKMKGKVIVPGTDIPDTGRYAVLADPLGAEFGVYHSRRPSPSVPDPRALGQFGWGDLNTTDWKSAWQFYSELFGWKHASSIEMGPELGEYFMFGLGGPKDAFGGMSNSAATMRTPTHWLHYINVKSTDETAKRISQGKGKVLGGPMDVPGGGRIARCADPAGAVFGVFSPS